MQALEYKPQNYFTKKSDSLECSCEDIIIRKNSKTKFKKTNYVCEICSEKVFLRRQSNNECLDCEDY